MDHPHRRRLLLAAAAFAGGAAGPPGRDRVDDGEGPIPGILAATGAPALAGGVVTAQGLIHFHAGGLRRAGAADRVTAGDRWHLGSNAKAMTAALYGRLVEQRRATWGATVPELFPDLTVDPAWKTATIEQLLGHRAGVEDRPLIAGGWLMKAHADTRPIREQRMEVARLTFAAPPTGEPGAFDYANVNYIIAGAAIERIAGASWEDAVRAELFRPLGVATAGFGAPTGDNPWGHSPRGGGLLGPPTGYDPVNPTGMADNPPALGPAGRVHMSLQDYARFVRLFLTKGDGVLKPETIERLVTPLPGEGQAYALGWGVRRDADGAVLAHEGSNTLWHAAAMIAPARGVALIAASNAPPQAGAVPRFMRHMQDEALKG